MSHNYIPSVAKGSAAPPRASEPTGRAHTATPEGEVIAPHASLTVSSSHFALHRQGTFFRNKRVGSPPRAPAVLHEPQHMGRRPHVLHVPHHPSWRLVDKELSFAAHAQRILVAPRSGRTGLPLSSVLGGFPLQPLAICLERLESGRPFRHLAGSRFRLFGSCGGLGRHVPSGDQRVVPHETILLIPAFAACPVSCTNKIASGHRTCSLHHSTTTYRRTTTYRTP